MSNTIFQISTDKSLLNVNMIHDFLSKNAYWAKGRTKAITKRSIAHSLCFGVYTGDEQIGFARVATDYTIFAWIMDVFILPSYRGQGASKLLMQSILQHEELSTLKRWGLVTRDAHGLYQQFGFRSIHKEEMFMEWLPKETT